MKAVFLDRDGVINKYPGHKKYVTCWAHFKFLPHALEALALFRKHGFKVFVVSNQAGVGKGLYSKKALDLLTRNMLRDVRKAGGDIRQVYYCTHRPEEGCACRKPKPGLILAAKKKHRLSLKNVFFVGDSMLDVLTARAAGIRSILVLSGREKIEGKKEWAARPDFVLGNLFEAALFITHLKK